MSHFHSFQFPPLGAPDASLLHVHAQPALPQWGYQRTWGNFEGSRQPMSLHAHCILKTMSPLWGHPTTLSILVYLRDPRPLQCGYPPKHSLSPGGRQHGVVSNNDRHDQRHEGRCVKLLFSRDLNTCERSAGISSFSCGRLALSTPPGRWR